MWSCVSAGRTFWLGYGAPTPHNRVLHIMRRVQDRRELAGPGRAARPGRSRRAAPGRHRSRHRRDLLVPGRRRRRPVRGGAQVAEGFRMPAAGRARSLDLEPARGRAGPIPPAGDPGGGRERRADLRRRRREGCGCLDGPRPFAARPSSSRMRTSPATPRSAFATLSACAMPAASRSGMTATRAPRSGSP